MDLAFGSLKALIKRDNPSAKSIIRVIDRITSRSDQLRKSAASVKSTNVAYVEGALKILNEIREIVQKEDLDWPRIRERLEDAARQFDHARTGAY